MKRHHLGIVATSLVAVLAAPAVRPSQARDDLGKRAGWSAPSAADVKAQIDEWLETQNVDAATRSRIEAIWPAEAASRSDAILEQVALSIAAVDEGARELVAMCQREPGSPSPPHFDFLADERTPGFVRNNLRLLYGRWLAQHHLYDEAREQLDGLTLTDVVDPASLLFYQGVVHHRLLDKQKCLDSVTRLLENEEGIPRRYASVARLLEADIRPLETDSLDEVSRLMDDIRRRLHFGRAGTRVRQEQDEVIAKLDKMIEELKKRQQQQQSSGGSQGNIQSSNPAPDSMPLGGKGPGDVDQKGIGNKSGWGNLPPKERQEALQQISKDLPAHFREVIEEYFRKLARDEG